MAATQSIISTNSHKTRSDESHKRSRTPEYYAWQSMHQRCTNPSNPEYRNYGARGIVVCNRWRFFGNFFSDMGPRPSPSHQLDRYPNNNGNYEPGNVRWATPKENSRNKRQHRLLTFDGRTQCVAAWAEEKNMPEQRLISRIRRGWSIEKALTAPAGKRGRFSKK